jgi:hypothetical protein
LFASATALAQSEQADLAKQTQNPVSDLISVPFQNNTSFGIGPNERTQNVLNIQPVVPVTLNDSWNVVARTIVPVVTQPDVLSSRGSTTGVGDVNASVFFSPSRPSRFIWGAGPVVSLPTATDEVLGSDKWGFGPSFVGLTMRGPWVIGALVNNVWSVGGNEARADVNQFLLQYFVNYNLPNGWYLSSAPILVADWESDDDRWLVPFGGGVGKIFRIGGQPVNGSIQAFYNAVVPKGGPAWTLRLQLQLLFPK